MKPGLTGVAKQVARHNEERTGPCGVANYERT